MAMNEEVMKEKLARAWAIIDTLSGVKVAAKGKDEQLTHPFADTTLVRDVVSVFRSYGQELVDIAETMKKQADFADSSRDAEEIAALAFSKSPGAFKKEEV